MTKQSFEYQPGDEIEFMDDGVTPTKGEVAYVLTTAGGVVYGYRVLIDGYNGYVPVTCDQVVVKPDVDPGTSNMHDEGDVVCFLKPDGDKQFGTIQDVHLDRGGKGVSYMVKGDDGYGYHIRPNAIVDLAQVSRDATAALEKFARQDRARADLLSELLGKLSYYADRLGHVRYMVEGKIYRADLRELVDEYLAKRDAV